MKKSILIAALALGLAGTAAAETTWQKSITLEGIHNMATEDEYVVADTNTSGLRISGSLYSQNGEKYHHQFTLALSGAAGSNDDINADITVSSITIGYFYNYDLSDKLTVFAGGRVGRAVFDVEYDDGFSDDASGFTYAVGIGAKYQINEKFYVQASLEYGMSTFGVEGADEDLEYGANTISVGVGYQF